MDSASADSGPVEVRVLHFVPGRIRIEVGQMKDRPAWANRTRSRLKQLPGVHSIRTNTLTGTLRVDYDPETFPGRPCRQDLADVLDVFVTAIREERAE